MDIRIIHFYPDLMSLYGSYANVSVLRRRLEQMGNSVTVEVVRPGETADLSGADFLFMGAGTERSQKAALTDFARFGDTVKAAAENGTAMLFCGTAMELLGKRITDAAGTVYEGIGLAGFSSVQSGHRIVGDVYGSTSLCDAPVVGFINKCSTITDVETPLLSGEKMGFGNESKLTAEGFLWKNVMGSHLTGPILVKNPRLLDKVVEAIYARQGQVLPETMPVDPYAEAGYAITEDQLRKLCQ